MQSRLKARATHACKGALLVLSAALLSSAAVAATGHAPTPPMGWNSWDAYGFTITEDQFKANATIVAGMKRHGWDTAVIDEGWYMGNPLGDKLETRAYQYDAYGRLMPVPARFPSAADGNGLKGLADWTHKQGLKFGLHIVRGIPRAAVEANMPIAGSRFRAAEAADKSDKCPWDDSNYGIADNEAGQAYYDSLAQQYSSWGVDFIKIDCISDHPYKGAEIRQVATAIRKAPRPMILSLSPGPTNIAHAAEVAQYSQMWRIMDDLWDGWTFPHPDPKTTFPNGVRNAFDSLAQWNSHVRPGQWPDADMLPFGSLYPHPGWGDPRQSRLTEAETRTAFTLWAIARSPLILGGNLTQAPSYLLPMLSNDRVIGLNQGNRVSRSLETLPASLAAAKVWLSGARGGAVDTVAVFNVGEKPLRLDAAWTALGLPGARYAACDLWTGASLAAAANASATVASHDVALLRVSSGQGKCIK
jgi:alpha-galactosidase